MEISANTQALAYLVSAILFILALKIASRKEKLHQTAGMWKTRG